MTKPGCAPVAVGLALLAAAALALTGCGPSAVVDGGFDGGGCYGPMVCGGVMPVYYHPYIAYMRDPVHSSINIVNNRVTTVYRPPAYSPPRPAPAAAARPAAPAPKPAAPRPAPPVKSGKK